MLIQYNQMEKYVHWVWTLPFKQISDEKEDEGIGQSDVKMWDFGIDPALPVFKISPGQIHRQPESVPPEPLI